MNNEHKPQSIHDTVLGAIKSGRVEMKPRWYFVLKSLLAMLGGVVLVLSLIYLASFVIFVLRQTGILFVPAYGLRGWYTFLISLPWVLILLLILFVFVLEILVRQYAFAYRRPLLYSALGIVGLMAAGGYVVASTPLHSHILTYVNGHSLPVAGPFYRQVEEKRIPRNIHHGRIAAFTYDGFTLAMKSDRVLVIVITPETRLPLGSPLKVGDMVMVFGDAEGNTVRAFGVRPFPMPAR